MSSLLDNTVVIIPCNSYDREAVSTAMKSIFEHLGGLHKLTENAQSIFVKPNILRSVKPETATTTHPEVIYSLIKSLVNIDKTVLCGDSPNFITMNKMVEGVYNIAGITNAVKEAGGITSSSAASVQVIGGEYLKTFHMLKAIKDSDMVINVAKAKTHAFAGYTGAVKNLFGVIPGPIKGEMHLRYPNASSFANAMIDICETVNAKLHIVDAIVGMEGPGPSSGTPKHLGVLVAGTNPYSVDEVVIELMGIDKTKIAQIKEARVRCLTQGIEKINILGANIENHRANPPFEPAAPKDDFLNAFIKNILPPKMYIKFKKKPIVNEVCIGCGICAEACPPKTISIKNKKAVIDYSDCIKCYCCQELCPKSAISLNKLV